MKTNKFTTSVVLGASLLTVGQVGLSQAALIDGKHDQAGPGWVMSASTSFTDSGITYVSVAFGDVFDYHALIPRQIYAERLLD